MYPYSPVQYAEPNNARNAYENMPMPMGNAGFYMNAGAGWAVPMMPGTAVPINVGMGQVPNIVAPMDAGMGQVPGITAPMDVGMDQAPDIAVSMNPAMGSAPMPMPIMPSTPVKGARISMSMQSLDPKVVELLTEVMENEQMTAKYYEKMMQALKDETGKKMYREARMDEIKHFKIMQEIYYRLAGSKPVIKSKEPIGLGELRSEVEKSIMDKVEVADLIRKIYFVLEVPILKDMVFEVLMESQAHAIKFTFLYGKMR